MNSWDRIKKLVRTLGDLILEHPSGNPMRIKKRESYKWLTTQDLAFLTLYCLYMLVEECWRRKILLIGITKDTTARDFKSHVIPVCVNASIWNAPRHPITHQRKFRTCPTMREMRTCSVRWKMPERSRRQTLSCGKNRRKAFRRDQLNQRGLLTVPRLQATRTHHSRDTSADGREPHQSIRAYR